LKYGTIKKYLTENINYIDVLLDKINKSGKESLSADENLYLKQYNNQNIDRNLEKWIFSNDELTFDDNDNKLLYDEFEDDEDIFYNENKLIRIISKHLNKKPFTNNADWGGAFVWKIQGNDNFSGIFLVLDDNELIVIKRTTIDDQYDDEIMKNIYNSKDLYRFFLTLK
jgi:hypothetical protein